MELDIREQLAKAIQKQDVGALRSAYRLVKGTTTASIPSVLYVICAEEALQLGCVEMSSDCLNVYFERDPPGDQLLCRALLCQGQLKSLQVSPVRSVEDIKEPMTCFLRAIEMSKKEPSTHFLVFNGSVLYFQTVRLLLQPGLCCQLVPSFKQVVESLEEVADPDLGWRAELMIHLVKCILDSGQAEEAASFGKVAEAFIRSNTPHLYPRLYKLQVQHKLLNDDVLLEASRQCTAFEVIYKIQHLKNRWMGLNENMLMEEDSVKLKEIFSLLVDSPEVMGGPVNSSFQQSPTPFQVCDRTAFLLELALLSLQLKHPNVAADCLKQLKLAGEINTDQRVIMECVSCEINLLKKEAKMNDYSKASVEVRLKEIDKLDQWLQAAVREASPQAVQVVCVTQWNVCLSLLQHNLRKRLKTPLLKLAQVLEDMQSLLLKMRCEVHSELAAIAEEEGDLEAFQSHLEKALLLDNGTQREHLSSALRLLQLRRTHQTPACPEDKAAMLMQQIRDMPSQQSKDRRPILVSVGLLLAPAHFQTLLDADNTSTFPAGSLGLEAAAKLAAKAQHHSICVERLKGYLDTQSKDRNDTERCRLWAMLAKTARKQEVWDVCRAACHFSLLYDDGRWKSSEFYKSKRSGEKSAMQSQLGQHGNKNHVPLLRLFAEICFISGEATIQKLKEEGVQLNSPAVPVLGINEGDPSWVIYRDWIQGLSAYATRSFLRGGELGVEIGEPWLVENAAIYLWNYNSHLLGAGEYQLPLPTFQSLEEMLQRTKHIGSRTLRVMLCDAAACGLIQPLSDRESTEPTAASARGKNRADKGTEQTSSSHGFTSNPAALQYVRKALELCNYALCTSSCHATQEPVPVAVRKRVLTTWVQIKWLLHQQIGSKLEIFKDECEDEEVTMMNRVLVGLEMLGSNKNPKHMEFSVPSLSALVGMASECSWSDAVVELQVWCQLAAFCHSAKDHSLVLRCTQKALQMGEAAAKDLSTMPCLLYGQTAVNEMLSSAACLRGLSLVCKSSGNLDSYREALKLFLSGVSFAEKADSGELCVTAAGHFWNVCLPLTQSSQDRLWLKENLEKILNGLIHTSKYDNKHGKRKGLPTSRELHHDTPKNEATQDDKELCLRASIIGLLVFIHMDKEDLASSLQLLDTAISDMPDTKHRLPLLKRRILLKTRLGKGIECDMQMLQDEGEQCRSEMWHHAALCAVTLNQQLICYQNAVTCLTSSEFQGPKVNLLLEFGAWMYFHNFPKSEAELQVQWAVDIILHLGSEKTTEPDDMDQKHVKTEAHDSSVGVPGRLTQNLSGLKEVCRLDQLTQAHTLLAVMSDRTSPEHQHNLLLAHTFVLQIWQVSVAAACEIFNEMAKNQPIRSPPSAGSKKSKGKGKDKKALDPIPAEEKPNFATVNQRVPSTLREWARYICPDQTRQIFTTNRNPQCINKYSFRNLKQSLYYLRLLEKELCSVRLDYLALPVLHLAEIISHDLLERKSLSDLLRLRIVSICAELGFDSLSPYQETLHSFSKIQELEQIRCRKNIILLQERRGPGKIYNEKAEQIVLGQLGEDVSSQDVWLEKAAVCLGLGLYQSTRELLAEAHMVAKEIGDKAAEAKSLLGLATLACEEQNYAMALILLDRAQTLNGDHEFWYQLTLARVRAVVGQRDRASQAKVDQIIKQGCEALQLITEFQVRRLPERSTMITSLQKRGAVECIRAISDASTGQKFSTEVVQRLKAACDTLRVSAASFTRLNCREDAAEAHEECAYCLRLLGSKVTNIEDRQGYLLDGLSQMQQAVSLQEQEVLSAQRMFVSQESCTLSLKSMRKLLHLRLCLTEFCLEIFEQCCAKQTQQALSDSKKTCTEIALEEFTRESPPPNSTEMKWENTGRTLGQTILSQLATVNLQASDRMEIRARCLGLMGKYLRLLAVQEEPLYVRALWHKRKQQAFSDSQGVPAAEGNSKKHRDSSRRETAVTSACGAELQNIDKARNLLAEASKALSESISLCLHHNLPSNILAEASFNILECHGQTDPTVTGQYLALYQSCCTVDMVAEVFSSACADTSKSQFSALLSFHRNLFLPRERSNMLRRVEDSLHNLSKAFSQLTISPKHLNILSEIPPNLKILLLQHSNDGSELFGGFYEATEAPENHKAKTSQPTGPVICSQVAKVSVRPQALVALREQTRVFGLENKDLVLEDESSQLETSEKTTRDAELTLQFGEIVETMEDYLNPLLSQFDFSFIRSQDAPLPVSEISKSKIKQEYCGSDKVNHGEHLVVLADWKLLELPLEALPVLQKEGLSSVSRDFSLQLFFSRLNCEEAQKVEGDNKKETKGGKGTKGKGDQSQAIKAAPANHVLPTFTVDTSNLKYIVDPYQEGHFEKTSLSAPVKEVVKTHRQNFPHLWEAFITKKDRPSLSDMEQMLTKCSAFIYVGMDPLLTSIPPAQVAALNLTDCRMALLFDQVQNKANVLPSNNEAQKSAELLTLQNSQETALLLSLSGVGCIVLSQWHSTLQQKTHDLASVLDNILRFRQTSGQATHALRGWERSGLLHHKVVETYDQALNTDSNEDEVRCPSALNPTAYNCVLYGLPNLIAI